MPDSCSLVDHKEMVSSGSFTLYKYNWVTAIVLLRVLSRLLFSIKFYRFHSVHHRYTAFIHASDFVHSRGQKPGFISWTSGAKPCSHRSILAAKALQTDDYLTVADPVAKLVLLLSI